VRADAAIGPLVPLLADWLACHRLSLPADRPRPQYRRLRSCHLTRHADAGCAQAARSAPLEARSRARLGSTYQAIRCEQIGCRRSRISQADGLAVT
jgi:hypothetical protein